MISEREKLEALAGLGIELNSVSDLDILMEKILTEARRFVNADAGSIYIKKGENLHFTYTQNATLKQKAENGKLIYTTFSMPITKKSVAGYAAATGELTCIPDVYALDGDVPYGHDSSFDKKTGYHTQSMLAVPLKNVRGDILGVLQVINAQDDHRKVVAFGHHDEKMMRHFASVASTALERAQMTRAILLRMIRMSEMRDPKETGAHVNRVGAYSLELYEKWARARNIEEDEIEKTRDSLRMAAMLHDVGKVAISDKILKKPGKLDHDEYETMKLHTLFGAQLFLDDASDFDEAAMTVALNHHERWDGRGYPGHINPETGRPIPGKVNEDGTPMGKRGEEIPLFGRIVALADVYDALSSKRVYKEAWDESQVLAELQKGAGTQFDPELISIFFDSLDQMRAIRERYTELPEEDEVH